MIWVLTGTRPDIIKLAPVIWELKVAGLQSYWIHSGQHYDDSLSNDFFDFVVGRKPDFVFPPCPESDPDKKVVFIKSMLMEMSLPCSHIVVLGDTATTLAGALFGAARSIPVVHVEAGLRSNDLRTPEELIRIVTDQLSSLLLTPCLQATRNLAFRIPTGVIEQVGNTIIDTIKSMAKKIPPSLTYAPPGKCILVTIHRSEHLYSKHLLNSIFVALNHLVAMKVPVIFPVHPHTKSVLDRYKIPYRELLVIDPVNYLTFTRLLLDAKIVITDSGGVQEEAYLHGVPCAVLRASTERPETVQAKATVMVDPFSASPRDMLRAFNDTAKLDRNWPRDAYGEAGAGERVVKAMRNHYGL